MKTFWALCFFFLGTSLPVLAQEEKEEEEPHAPQIRVALMMANTHAPKAFEGEKQVAIIPTWGADVDYFFHPKWSIALQADLLIQSFEVETEDLILERNYPFSTAFVVHYHAKRHWSFYLGPGYEFEKSENLFLVKFGTEYSVEINEDWEIGINLAFEQKEEIYDSWLFGIAFNKRIWVKD